MTTQTGKVKLFNDVKNYGCITPDDGSKDVFVHKNGINGSMLYKEDKVSFAIEDGPKGLSAVNVTAV